MKQRTLTTLLEKVEGCGVRVHSQAFVAKTSGEGGLLEYHVHPADARGLPTTTFFIFYLFNNYFVCSLWLLAASLLGARLCC